MKSPPSKEFKVKTSSRIRKTKKTVNHIMWIGCVIWLVRNFRENHKKNRYATEPLPEAEAL